MSFRKKRRDAMDFHREDVGRLFAGYKKAGGKDAWQRLLDGAPLPTSIASLGDAKHILDVPCKYGPEVARAFTTSWIEQDVHFDRFMETVDNVQSEVMRSEVYLATTECLTSVTKRVSAYELQRTIQHPFSPIPLEFVPQIAEHVRQEHWKNVLWMLPQPLTPQSAHFGSDFRSGITVRWDDQEGKTVASLTTGGPIDGSMDTYDPERHHLVMRSPFEFSL